MPLPLCALIFVLASGFAAGCYFEWFLLPSERKARHAPPMHGHLPIAMTPLLPDPHASIRAVALAPNVESR